MLWGQLLNFVFFGGVIGTWSLMALGPYIGIYTFKQVSLFSVLANLLCRGGCSPFRSVWVSGHVCWYCPWAWNLLPEYSGWGQDGPLCPWLRVACLGLLFYFLPRWGYDELCVHLVLFKIFLTPFPSEGPEKLYMPQVPQNLNVSFLEFVCMTNK